MQYWKQIKSSVSKKIFDNKETTSVKDKKEQVTQTQKETKIKAILNLFKQKQNEKENQELQQSTQKIESKPSTMINGRIWMASSSSAMPNDNQSKDQPMEQIEEVDGEAAAQFMSNICAFGEQCERQNKMRINKAKMQMFRGIQIEPIYLQQHNINKIMNMEMQYSYNEFRQQKCISLIERTQALVIERDSVDRAIETALTSGYLWQANGLQNHNFIQVCYQTIENSMQNVDRLIDQVFEFRKRIKYLIQFYLKVNLLNKKRVELAKKVKLLKKINSFKKDICQKFINIDQAFHIERDRQKMYAQLTEKPLISYKVMLTKNLLSLANEQNRKVRKIVEEKLLQWIDKQGKLQDKHIQKLLILLYFIRNEKMYKSSQCKIDLLKIVNKDKFVAQLIKVRSWSGYRYLNDKGVKEKVGLFLEQLIKELTNNSSNQQEDLNKKFRKQNKRQIQVQGQQIGEVISSVVQKNQNIIKF